MILNELENQPGVINGERKPNTRWKVDTAVVANTENKMKDFF